MSNPRRIDHGRGTSSEITYGVDGRMARRRFGTKKQATDALAQARVDNARRTAILPAESRVTVSAYADRWMATLQVRPSTRAMYASHLKVHIRPLLGHRSLSSLRRSDNAAFVAQLCDRGLKPSTVRGIFNVSAMILRVAVYDRLLPVSPCYRIKVPAVTRRSLEVFTPEQVHALLDAVWDCDRAVLATAVGTGWRQGEVLGLRLAHVNLLRRELAVEEQALTPPQGQPYITRELPTAASRRVVPLPQFVIHAIARHLEVYGAGPDGELFLNRRGLVWRRGSFNDSVWKPTLRRAGLPRVTASTPYGTPPSPRPWTPTGTCSPRPLTRPPRRWTCSSVRGSKKPADDRRPR